MQDYATIPNTYMYSPPKFADFHWHAKINLHGKFHCYVTLVYLATCMSIKLEFQGHWQLCLG